MLICDTIPNLNLNMERTMSSNSQKKAIAGGLIALSAVGVIALSTPFNQLSQMIKDAKASNMPEPVWSPEQQLGMDGYHLLERMGYGSIGQGYSVHITREETTFKNPENPWAGVTMVFNTTAPGTISRMMVTVGCDPTDTKTPGPSQTCSIKL
jgi:hypothetical protein